MAGKSKNQSKTASQKSADAVAVIAQIYNILYLDMDSHGDFYNPDKEHDSDTLDAIVKLVNEWKPAPKAKRA
jgi:hypothetical protein